MVKYQISSIELYSPFRHGELESNLQYMYNNYLINETIDINEYYTKFNSINKAYMHKYKYINRITNNNCGSHPFIRNYTSIIKSPKHFELKIVEPVKIYFGPDEEDYYSIAIDKTIWIRLIQRRWREIQKKRIQGKTNINNLKYKEINGRWPKECYIPFRLGIK